MVKWLLFVDPTPAHLWSARWGPPRREDSEKQGHFTTKKREVKRETERQKDREGWREESLATEQPFALQGPPVWSNP